MWIKIPNLSGKAIGIGIGGNNTLSLNDYKLIIGHQTPLFTVADTVTFGLSKKYKVPLLLKNDRDFCLVADNQAVK